ncbi:hypothetical protein EAF00_005357 [Botryotinia globosa]|nr:hypothetical protein EAF00_005357 [Botryotinia globosa]
MGTPLTNQDVLDLMSDLELDWLKIYDYAMREGFKTRAELLFGIFDSLDETMKSNPNEMAIIYLAMKERDEGMESKKDGKDEKWSKKMEMFEIEAASIVSTLPILPTPPIPSDSPTPQIIPILQAPPTPPIPEISLVTSTPRILSTSSMPPISSTELDTDHSSEFESESMKAMLKQERTPPGNINERKEAHADDLYSDDVRWTTPKSKHKSRGSRRDMVTDYMGKHGRVIISQHPVYFDIDHPDTFSSFIDAPNFDVERTSPLSVNRKPAFILLLQVIKQPPSLRVIKKDLEAVPDWHRIDHLLRLDYREYLWAIYSPADANVCMSYALKTWSRVQHHDPGLFSHQCFESSSSLINGLEHQSKEIENRKPSDISKSREFSENNFKKEALLQNYRARIMFEELYSNLTKSPFDTHVKLNGIYSGARNCLANMRFYQMLLDAWFGHKCGHASYDNFTEFTGREGAVVDFAKELMKAGYITRAQITSQPLGVKLWVSGRLQNGINLILRKLSKIRNTSLPTFVIASLPKTPVCLPADECRWLHLCMKKKPYATHLKPLHVCKDENHDPLTDKTSFKALKHAYNKEKTWKDWAILKLRKIEFIGFEACPGGYVDHIKPNDLPPTTNEYDFAPPPPPKMAPPIGPEHMLHLFQDCLSISDVNSTFYLQRIPHRKIEPIAFNTNRLSENLGWGLHFVKGLNTSLAITVMFILSLVLGIAFAIC